MTPEARKIIAEVHSLRMYGQPLDNLAGNLVDGCWDIADDIVERLEALPQSVGSELADRLEIKYAAGAISINQVAKEACAALRAQSSASPLTARDGEELAIRAAQINERWRQALRDHLGRAYPAFDSEWDDGAGRIADAILADKTLLLRKSGAARPQAAIDALTNHQVQCDEDGVMIQVSRQALDEVLTYLGAVGGSRE